MGAACALEPDKLAHARRLAEAASRVCGRGSHEDDRLDLEQTALTAIVAQHVRGTYDPSHGVDWGAYMWRVAKCAAYHARVRQKSPVHGSADAPSGTGIHVARGVPLPERLSVLGADCRTPEGALALEEFRARVRARVEASLGPTGAKFALALLGGEYHEREFEAAHGVPVTEVRALGKAIRRILQRDPELRRAWRERND
jgi:hypothetical protein